MRGIASHQQVNLDLSSYARFDQILNSQSPALIMSSSWFDVDAARVCENRRASDFSEAKTSDFVYLYAHFGSTDASKPDLRVGLGQRCTYSRDKRSVSDNRVLQSHSQRSADAGAGRSG